MLRYSHTGNRSDPAQRYGSRLLLLLDTGQPQSLADLVRGESLDQTDVTHWMRLTLLAPDLIEQLLAGNQPNWLTWRWLRRHRLPADWSAQRRLFNPEL